MNKIVFGETNASRQEKGLPHDEENPLVQASQMIECHTPLKKLASKYRDDFVLVTGNKQVLEVS